MDLLEERVWPRVDRSGGPDACWLWTGCLTGSRGYGQIKVERKQIYVHRLVYEKTIGPIPEGLTIDHRYTCPRNCVNPNHLRTATSKQNNENHAGPTIRNTSGVRGVTFEKGCWRGRVIHNRVAIHVGKFSNLAEAEVAVIAKRIELHTYNDLDRVS
jgi:hypothetical protein